MIFRGLAEIHVTEFIANIDPTLPVCFLAFRPNFLLENHPGATMDLMERCVGVANDSGLVNAYCSGNTSLKEKVSRVEPEVKEKYRSEGARLAGSYALREGCGTHSRGCRACVTNQACDIKKYIPEIVT